jgi:hypothetical protein
MNRGEVITAQTRKKEKKFKEQRKKNQREMQRKEKAASVHTFKYLAPDGRRLGIRHALIPKSGLLISSLHNIR